MDLFELLSTLFIEILATSLGVYFGFIQGLKQDRQIKTETRSEEYRQVILTLSLEIETIGIFFEDGLTNIKKNGFNIKHYQVLPEPDCYNSLINSGKFTLLEPKAQIIIAKFYSNIKTLNSVASEYLTCKNLEEFKQISDRIERVYEQTKNWYAWVKEYTDRKIEELQIDTTEYGDLPKPPSI